MLAHVAVTGPHDGVRGEEPRRDVHGNPVPVLDLARELDRGPAHAAPVDAQVGARLTGDERREVRKRLHLGAVECGNVLAVAEDDGLAQALVVLRG